MSLDLNYSAEPVVETAGMSNEEWLHWRTHGIGGSDAAAIYGVSPWTTPRALYYSKIGLSHDSPNQYTLDFGHVVEPYVAQWFLSSFEEKQRPWLEKQLGKGHIVSFSITKDTMMYRHPMHPIMQANLDYRFACIMESGEKITGVFECKTTSYHIFPEKWGWNKTPYYYELQCRHYMAVMNEDYAIIACLCGNNESDYCARLIKRDLDDEEDLIENEEAFWNDYVVPRVPPELSPGQGAQEMNALLEYGVEELVSAGKLSEVVPSTQAEADAVEQYLQAEQRIKILQDRIKILQNEQAAAEAILRAGIASHSQTSPVCLAVSCGGANAGKYHVGVKKRSSTRVDSQRLRKKAPEVFKEYAKTSTSESLYVATA